MTLPLLTPGVLKEARLSPMTTREIVVLCGGNPDRQARRIAHELREAGFEARYMRRLYHAGAQKVWVPREQHARPSARSAPLPAHYALAFRQLNVALPVRLDPANTGCILDRADRQLLVVDQDNEHPDAEVDQLAALVVVAINTAAGLPHG